MFFVRLDDFILATEALQQSENYIHQFVYGLGPVFTKERADEKFVPLPIVLGAIAAITGIYALASSGKKDDDGMKIVVAESGSITEKALAVGQIQPRQKFSVKSKISGIVKGCRVEVGQTVRAGDPILEIQPDPTPLELTEARREGTLGQGRDGTRPGGGDRAPGATPLAGCGAGARLVARGCASGGRVVGAPLLASPRRTPPPMRTGWGWLSS